MMMAITLAKIGRSMKNLDSIAASGSRFLGRFFGGSRVDFAGGGWLALRIDGQPRPGPLNSVDDYPIVGSDALFDDAVVAVGDAELHRPVLDDVLVVDHEQEFAAL